jgi:hypothetical protein
VRVETHAWASSQHRQQAEFVTRHFQRDPMPGGQTTILIQVQRSGGPSLRRGFFRDGPTQDSSHPRAEFAWAERFDHVVVGTQFQAHDAIDLARSRGQEDHRHI